MDRAVSGRQSSVGILPTILRIQLTAFLEYLRLNRNASAHTASAYESDLTQFLDFATEYRGTPHFEPGELELGTVRAFMAELYRQGHARTSVARKLSALRAFGRYLRREGLIETDPASLAATPKRERKVPAHLSIDEMTRLLEMPDPSDPLGCRDRAILELFYASGLRLSELVGLDLDDVNLRARMVRVMGKGAKERLVPFNSATETVAARLAQGARCSSFRRRTWSQRHDATSPKPEVESPEPGAVVSQLPRRPPHWAKRAASRRALRRGVQHTVRHQSARTATLLRHAPPGTRRRPARHPGAARARAAVDDSTLHARERRAVARRLSEGASAGKANVTTQ